MKRLLYFVLVFIFLFGISCKGSSGPTTTLVPKGVFPYLQITVVDNFEVIYQKAGYMKGSWGNVFSGFTGVYEYTEYTRYGKFPIRIHKGLWSSIFFEYCIEGQEPVFNYGQTESDPEAVIGKELE